MGSNNLMIAGGGVTIGASLATAVPAKRAFSRSIDSVAEASADGYIAAKSALRFKQLGNTALGAGAALSVASGSPAPLYAAMDGVAAMRGSIVENGSHAIENGAMGLAHGVTGGIWVLGGLAALLTGAALIGVGTGALSLKNEK